MKAATAVNEAAMTDRGEPRWYVHAVSRMPTIMARISPAASGPILWASARLTWVLKRNTTQGVSTAAQAQYSHWRWRSAQAIRPGRPPGRPRTTGAYR